MQLRDLAKGSSVFVGVIIAFYVSTAYVDRRFAPQLATNGPAACVGEDGSWKNWLWPNVPALSPKCE
ncbi:MULTISPECIES: hypothetical protein [unclassified Bradyrhizobium]|uniref:hypothetical protein n=1 Tax=unclassified Bradyrhizobium TaxID=2631580 RepID=UPI0002AABB8C|nr:MULTISPECIES: hypothetical protein [unclassified Bradyrhizobium]AMA60448.1 hypothetical protein BCCGELA001_32375 [Bradyrhizobium sp. CCGE-LA001]KYG97325.1 hypothetical protein SE91_00960 [Bradyrhizobium sp. DOA1]